MDRGGPSALSADRTATYRQRRSKPRPAPSSGEATVTLLPPHSVEPAGPLRVGVDVTAALVTLSGEFDSCSASRLTEAAPGLAAAHSAVWRVDAEEVTFCDGDGLAALLDLRDLAVRHGATLHLVGASRCLRRLIALVGLSDVLPVEPVGVERFRPVPERLRHPAERRARPPLPA